MLNRIGKAWDLLTAAAAAVAAGIWLPGAGLKDVTAELVTFFGVQAAVILPAMIFTAGILRPDGLSLPDAQRYRKALRSQMIFWIFLLALNFLSVAGLIVGKVADWTIMITEIQGVGPLDLSALLVGATAFLGALALLRTIPFVRGVLSLHELNSELTEKAIKLRDSIALDSIRKADAAQPFRKPEGFGKVVERH